MQRVIGIGESIYDIVFKGETPTEGVAGGSTFNAMLSLGRAKMGVTFISEVGRDSVGDIILNFMRNNNISTECVEVMYDGKTAVSLAFLDENGDAKYNFYRAYPPKRLNTMPPKIEEDDIFLFGSSYAIDEAIRDKITETVEYAIERKAIVIYDPNYRGNKKTIQIMPYIIENLEYADIIKGSKEDFENIFNQSDPTKVYEDNTKFYSPILIYTKGSDGVELFTPNGHKLYTADKIDAVSTIGAGDNFSAGIIYGLAYYGVKRTQLNTLSLNDWDNIIDFGMRFAKDVCLSYNNYISNSFASTLPAITEIEETL